MKKERMDVRKLLLLLASASFIAFLAVVGLVYYFGTSGTYLLRDILVSPETLEQNSLTHPEGNFAFNKIVFVRSEKHGQRWEHFAVSPQVYKNFYKLMYSERSVPVITDTMVNQFNSIAPSTLMIFVQEEIVGEEKIFQQVQFIDNGELFRVQFRPFQHTEMPRETWIYFRYPGIYEQVIALFAPTLEK